MTKVSDGRSRNRQRTETALVTAAAALFASHGFAGTSTRKIAETAGCSEALIQRYFGGKEGLLLAVLKSERRDPADSDFTGRPLCANLVDEVRETLNHVLDEFARMSQRMRIVFVRALSDPKFQQDFTRVSARRHVRSGIEARLQRYKDAGILDRQTDLRAASETLMGLAFHFSFIHRELLQTDEAEVRRLIEPVARIVGLGLAASTGDVGPQND